MTASRSLLLSLLLTAPAFAQPAPLLEGPPDRPMVADALSRLRVPFEAMDVTAFMIEEVSVWRGTLSPEVVDGSAVNLENPLELGGWPFAEVTTRVASRNGKAHGVGVFTYILSGRNAGRATFRDGVLHGVCILKHDRPANVGLTRTREVRCYDQGLRAGPSATWDLQGRMLGWGTHRGGRRHGPWATFDLETQAVQSTTRYEGGEPRFSEWWTSQRLRVGLRVYSASQDWEEREWLPTGHVARTVRAGEETGWRTTYDRSGARELDLWLERGVPTGPRFEYLRWGSTVAARSAVGRNRWGVRFVRRRRGRESPPDKNVWTYRDVSSQAHKVVYRHGALLSVSDGKERKVLEVSLEPGAAQGTGQLWLYGDPDGAVTGAGAVNCHGVPIGEWSFTNTQGTKVSSGHYVPNTNLADRRSGKALPWVRIGSWTSWYPEGFLKSRRLHDAVTQQTTREEWHRGGQPKVRGSYLWGERVGEWEEWHPNGARSALGSFERGDRVGRWRRWWPNGIRAWEGVYHRGALQGVGFAWDKFGKTLPCTGDVFGAGR